MKTFFTAFLLFSSIFSQAQTYATPVAYMNELSSEFKQIQEATWSYTKSIAKSKSARKVNKTRLELIETITKALKRAKEMPEYQNEGNYRDSVINYLDVNLAVVSEDYEKIMDLEDIAEQSYDLMDAFLKAKETASDKLQLAGEKVDRAQEEFAKKHNVNIIQTDDKVSLRLKNASKVYTYYNPVYLTFFKAYKQEAYLIDALSKGDVAGIEQNKSSLAKFAQEGLDKLNETTAYEGDQSLKKACKEVMDFYLEETNKFQTLIDFYTKKEAFEKIKATVDEKKGKNLTQEEIDAYNKMVKEYNEASQEFNSINEQLNKKRSELIDQWNNTSAKFTNKHIAH